MPGSVQSRGATEGISPQAMAQLLGQSSVSGASLYRARLLGLAPGDWSTLLVGLTLAGLLVAIFG
jgi:hypothetical protein